MARNGILCLEGDWELSLIRRRSLLPVLELVKAQWDIPFIHRTASTRDEFRNIVEEWGKAKYQRYPILYLGFHGSRGCLWIGKELIPITDLVELAETPKNRIVHFGACETLSAPAKDIRFFLKMSGFVACCGFRYEVDWLHSSALEILILDELSRRSLTARNVDVFDKKLRKMAGTLVRTLGFRVWKRS